MRYRGLVLFATRNALLRRHVVVLVSISSVKKIPYVGGVYYQYSLRWNFKEVLTLCCLETTEKGIKYFFNG